MKKDPDEIRQTPKYKMLISKMEGKEKDLFDCAIAQQLSPEETIEALDLEGTEMLRISRRVRKKLLEFENVMSILVMNCKDENI
jgi:hypothetical protein